MKLLYRNCNPGERFACSRKQMRDYFADTEKLDVSFGGYTKSYSPDGKHRNHPQIRGIIVASVSRNLRYDTGIGANLEPFADRKTHLTLYPFSDQSYGEQAEKEFTSKCLPVIREWMEELGGLPATTPSRVAVLLVEWYMGELVVHRSSYA
ncbi:MAG: hypothetical protein ACK5LX_13745 [Oscillospiraceae bacterium]